MRAIVHGVGVAAFVGLPLATAAFAQGEVLDNADIVNLTEAGLPAEVIVAKIESTATVFDTSAEKLVALVQAGVHAEVLAAMAKASAASTSAASEPPDDEPVRDPEPAEQPRAEPEPVRDVSMARPFAVSIHEVTLDEYDRFTAAADRPPVDDGGWGAAVLQ